MPEFFVRETFFRPPEHGREASSLPAVIVNGLRLLLSRQERDHLFLPIRRMQYLAVVERDEIVFVDSQSYAHQDGVGGRLIRLAWQLSPASRRDSLDGPVPCEILYYFPNLKETHRRIIGELQKLLSQNLERQRPTADRSCRVLPFRR